MKFKLLLSLILISILLCGCSENDSKLKVGVMPDYDSIPLAIAVSQGYIDDIAITVPFKSALDRDSAFYSGAIDVCVTDLMSVILAIDADREINVLTVTNGKYCLVGDKSNKSVNSLENKSIGISSGTIIEYSASLLTKNAGKYINVPNISMRSSLLINGDLQAAVLPEPYAGYCIQNGCNLIDSTKGIGLGVIIANKQKKNKEKIEKLIIGYDKAVDYINTHTAKQNLNKIKGMLGFPKDNEIYDLPIYCKAIKPKKDEFQDVQQYLLKKSLIKKKHDISEVLSDE